MRQVRNSFLFSNCESLIIFFLKDTSVSMWRLQVWGYAQHRSANGYIKFSYSPSSSLSPPPLRPHSFVVHLSPGLIITSFGINQRPRIRASKAHEGHGRDGKSGTLLLCPPLPPIAGSCAPNYIKLYIIKSWPREANDTDLELCEFLMNSAVALSSYSSFWFLRLIPFCQRFLFIIYFFDD